MVPLLLAPGRTSPGYQIVIPVSDVFWNPPVIGEVPQTAGYVSTVPAEVMMATFNIDLFYIQNIVLEEQNAPWI